MRVVVVPVVVFPLLALVVVVVVLFAVVVEFPVTALLKRSPSPFRDHIRIKTARIKRTMMTAGIFSKNVRHLYSVSQTGEIADEDTYPYLRTEATAAICATTTIHLLVWAGRWVTTPNVSLSFDQHLTPRIIE